MADIVMWSIALSAGIIFTYAIFKTVKVFKSTTTKVQLIKKSLVYSIQLLGLPAGVQFAKLFWCLPYPESDVLDVDNRISCWSAGHVILVLVALLFIFILFFYFPYIFWKCINSQIVTKDESKHEVYLRLKYFENITGIDDSWVNKNFVYFASFNRFWAFFRPLNHVFNFYILFCYGVLFNARLWQSSLIFAMFVVLLIIFSFRPPYRITSLNFMIIWNYFCLSSMLMIGIMQNIDGIQSTFLVDTYIQVELILINVAWTIGTLTCLIYIYLRWNKIIFSRAEFFPLLFKQDYNYIDHNSKRFVFCAIKSRELVTNCMQTAPLVVPTHQLSYYIHLTDLLILQADAQLNPLRSTLRSLLDEMIEAYNTFAPKSIFTDSNKRQVHTTASNLALMLPDFTTRLHQRDMDMILVTPVKRRMLLKMFVVSCFMRATQSAYVRRRKQASEVVWKQAGRVSYVDEGFYDECKDNRRFLERKGLLSSRKPQSIYESTNC